MVQYIIGLGLSKDALQTLCRKNGLLLVAIFRLCCDLIVSQAMSNFHPNHDLFLHHCPRLPSPSSRDFFYLRDSHGRNLFHYHSSFSLTFCVLKTAQSPVRLHPDMGSPMDKTMGFGMFRIVSNLV